MHGREGSGGVFNAHFGEKLIYKNCIASNVQIAVILLLSDQEPTPAASITLISILRSWHYGLASRLHRLKYAPIKLLPYQGGGLALITQAIHG